MNNSVKEIIKRVANLTISNLGLEIPIKDLKEVVNKLGGDLYENERLPQFADGMITKEDDDKFSIVIADYKSDPKKNFSIAHELGHLFLHMGYKIDRSRWEEIPKGTQFKRLGVGESEYQANEFAACLLMPEDKYLEKLKEHYMGDGHYNLQPVADYFGVSVDTAKNRGRWLGYLAW